MITVVIRETGEELTLTAIDPGTGVDCIWDLIGNTGDLHNPEVFTSELDEDGYETGRYIISQGTYDWWTDYIDRQDNTEVDAEALIADLENAEADIPDTPELRRMGVQPGSARDYVHYRLREVGGVDMEMEAAAALGELDVIRIELLGDVKP